MGQKEQNETAFLKKNLFIVVLGVRPYLLDRRATLGTELWGDLWVYLRGEVLPLPHRVSILDPEAWLCVSQPCPALLALWGWKGCRLLVPTHQGVRLHQVRHHAYSVKMDFRSPEPRLTLEQKQGWEGQESDSLQPMVLF